jgi:hypothetical protein
VAAFVVLQLPGIRLDIFERDPGAHELEGRAHRYEGGVLMHLLLGAIKEEQALEGHRRALEELGEKAHDGLAADHSTRASL